MKNRLIFKILFVMMLVSCGQHYTPKPGSYFRIDFPEKKYQLYDSICPFIFEYPVYGEIVTDDRHILTPCLFNIHFPKYKGTIHLTYLEIDNNFDLFIEENWKMIFQRLAQRADAVDENLIFDPEVNVFGMLYDIRGNAASSVQFFVTDSVKNFIRGSLYFTVRPNADSLAPVISFFRQDIIHLLETIEWKK